ncbi:MAG: TolC family protein, partial [Cyanothece sp. SIO2G6]|nr:TolC family protein [Cyanothece sp. SIO2G6]
LRINQDTLEQSRISLRDALAREQAGVGTRFDRLQAEVQLAEDEQDLVNSLRDQSVSRRAIADLLSLGPGIDLSASDPVEVAGAWALPLESTLLLAYRNRAELEQQLVQRDLNKEQERATLASRWPQLSAFASYNMNDLLDNTRVASDFEDLSVGLQLSWTLYNGGATRAAARQLEIEAERAETEFADTREAIRLQVEEEFLNLGAEFKNIQTAESAVGLAEEALRLARLRFGAGVGIQSDVLEAQTQLSEAEGRLVSAILGYNRALIGIQRAVSNWPDNNLSADPVRESLTIRD